MFHPTMTAPGRRAGNYYSVIANMRGKSAEEVAGKILASELLRGLQVGRNSAARVTGSTKTQNPTQSSTLSKTVSAMASV
jgi:hypothetical protein